VLEDSPILRLDRAAGGFELRGRVGTVHCRGVLLATNVFSEELGYLKRRILPIMTFASISRPLTDAELQAFGGQLNWGLTPADPAGTTVRMTADRRLIIRSQYQYTPRYRSTGKTRRKVRRIHEQALWARYPGFKSLGFDHTWGGVCGLSRNYVSFFGKLEPGLYAAACHNGVGAARGTISGKLLADLAVGADSSHLQDIISVSGMPARNPPEPLLGYGVRSRLRFTKWISRSEF
jgi:glycine/D-amino acid oxidase-like deaminating enzyme